MPKSKTSFDFNSSNLYYLDFIYNNAKVKFRLQAIDIFGQFSSYVETDEITRYDISGVTIGKNGKWVNCQIYYGQNGSWVECSVDAGINGAWVDADDGT